MKNESLNARVEGVAVGMGRDEAHLASQKMPYDEQIALVKKSGWGNRGEWNNWFHPASGWNYSLSDAVQDILMYRLAKDRSTVFAG